MQAAVDAIDAIHTDGALPRIPIVQASPSADFEGAFAHDPSGPIQIEIHPNTSTPQMTAVHEIGHFLDRAGIGNPTGMATELAAAGNAEFPELTAWWDTVNSSDAVTQLRALQEAGGFADSGMMEYLLRPREIWARSYAQWIATNTPNSALSRELSLLRPQSRNRSFHIPMQWSDRDFAPISGTIEDLFRTLGWIP